MHWPEYDNTRRSNGNHPWLALLMVGSAIGLIFAGAINGWWSLPFVEAGGAGAEPAVSVPLDGEPAATPTRRQATGTTPGTQAKAPPFALVDLFDAAATHSLSDYAGRPVILNFWASWCVPCRNEMPALQRAYEDGRQAGLVVLGINETFIDSLTVAQAFYRELQLAFPSARDDTGITSEKGYQLVGLPTTVFISPAGQIAHRHIGQMTEEQIQQFSQQLLAGRPVGP